MTEAPAATIHRVAPAPYLAVREIAIVPSSRVALSLVVQATKLAQAFYIPSGSMEDTLGR